jgi:two-component system, sensor histidine kinase and response regulator
MIGKPTYEDLEQRIRVLENDLAELRQSKEELHESEVIFRQLAEAAFEGIVIHSDGETLDVNQSAMRMFGYDYKESVGKSVLDFIEPESIEIVLQRLREITDESLEVIGKKEDGTTLHLEVAAKTISWMRKPARVVALHDITERKRAEDKLRRSEERYRILVDTANEGIWSMDDQHRSTYVNRAMADMLGYKPEEILGCRVEDFFFPGDAAFHEERMEKRHFGVDEVYERRFRRRDGTAL